MLDEGDVASLLTSAMGAVSYLDKRIGSSVVDGGVAIANDDDDGDEEGG